MFLRFIPLFALLPTALLAWDSGLPFSNGTATGTGSPAFANPAGTALESGKRLGLALADWETEKGKSQRFWGLQNQGQRHAEGFRYWEGSGPYMARLDLAMGTEFLGLFSPGIRPAYVWDGKGRDHAVLDAGLDFRPLPQALAGYWAENLWTGSSERRVHHLAAALRPWGSGTGALADLVMGYALEKPEKAKRRGFLFSQIPLGFGFRIESQWNFSDREGNLGLSLQATEHWAGALGLAKGRRPQMPGMENRLGDNVADGRHRQAALEFREEQKTPFLVAEGNVAELDLNRTMVEGRTPEGWFASGGEIGFLDLMDRFDVIEANPRIKSALVRLGNARCGWAMGEEIRDRILRLRGRGIRVVAYMEQVTPLNYFLASLRQRGGHPAPGLFRDNGFCRRSDVLSRPFATSWAWSRNSSGMGNSSPSRNRTHARKCPNPCAPTFRRSLGASGTIIWKPSPRRGRVPRIPCAAISNPGRSVSPTL